jgi:itaconate CoA-transferase
MTDPTRPDPTPPLAGITVVSLEQAVAAPFATRQLADLGARVIKIERPDGGDFARGYDEAVHGNSSYFVWLNRSKESLTLDLKSAEGRQILDELLDGADVLVQNLGPGAATRLGLDPGSLAQRHPRVIPCSVTGWGSTGPWAHRKAYDLLVQCEAGLLSVTGTELEMAKVGISVADIAAGMYAYSGILTALLRRATTGQVGAVEVSLFEALTEWMGSPAYYAAYSGRRPERVGAEHATIAPYGPYRTADGTILLAVQNDREWRRLCAEVLDDAELATDPRFASNSARVAHRTQLNKIIGTRLAEVPTADAATLLDQVGVASAGITEVEDLAQHPVLAGRNRWHTVAVPGGTMQALRPPAELAGIEPVMGAVPALGEHTDAVLRELGRSEGRVAELHAARVV